MVEAGLAYEVLGLGLVGPRSTRSRDLALSGQ